MTDNPCIVIADRARARLFSLAGPENTTFERGGRLREEKVLVSPDGNSTDMQLFRDRSGRKNRMSLTGGGYGADDHRKGERMESARRFGKEIGASASELMRSHKSKELVLIAAPKFLGTVRAEIRKALPKGTMVKELAEDLSWHALPNIEDVLMQHGVLPPREFPDEAYRPRSQHHEEKKRRRPSTRP